MLAVENRVPPMARVADPARARKQPTGLRRPNCGLAGCYPGGRMRSVGEHKTAAFGEVGRKNEKNGLIEPDKLFIINNMTLKTNLERT